MKNLRDGGPHEKCEKRYSSWNILMEHTDLRVPNGEFYNDKGQNREHSGYLFL